MKLRKVDPRKIRVPEVRVTAQMSAETAEQFKSSVKEVGIDDPIKCYLVGEELWLSDGKHRLQEALELGLELVDITVREGTMVDVMCNNLMSGHLRGKHPISQMRKVITELFKVHGIGIEEIQKRTGLTQAYVENLLLVSELTPLVLATLDEERIGLGIALLLAKIKDPVEQEKHFWMQQNYHLSGEAFRQYLKEYEAAMAAQAAPPAPVVERPPALIKCAYCGDEHKLEELSSVITCRACAGILYQATAQARREFEADQRNSTKPFEGTAVDPGASQ